MDENWIGMYLSTYFENMQFLMCFDRSKDLYCRNQLTFLDWIARFHVLSNKTSIPTLSFAHSKVNF